MVHHRIQPGLSALILRENPGLRLIDIFIRPADQLPDLLQCQVKTEAVHADLDTALCRHRHGDQILIRFSRFRRLRNDSSVILFYHGHRTAHQISEIVCQIVIQTVEHHFVCIESVLTESILTEQEIFQGIDAVAFDQLDGIHHIASGFRHLAAFQQNPAVTQHFLRQRQVERHQHSRPDNRMEPDDFLSHQMNVGRPVFFKETVLLIRVSQSRNIVGKSIQPDIYDVLRIGRNADAPVEGTAGNTQVVESLSQEAEHLVSSRLRLQKFRILFQQIDQPVLISGKAEKIRLLAGFFHRSSAVRTLSVHRLYLCPERLTRRTVQSFIFSLIDIALFVHLFKDRLHTLHMPVLRRTDKIVIGDFHSIPQSDDSAHDIVHVLLRCHAVLRSHFLDFLTVLVRAGQETDIISRSPLKPCHRIGHDGTVSVSDVKIRAGIINRCRYIKSLFLHSF